MLDFISLNAVKRDCGSSFLYHLDLACQSLLLSLPVAAE